MNSKIFVAVFTNLWVSIIVLVVGSLVCSSSVPNSNHGIIYICCISFNFDIIASRAAAKGGKSLGKFRLFLVALYALQTTHFIIYTHTHTHTHTHTYTFSMIFSIPLFWTVGKSYVSSIILLQFNIILVVSSHQLHPVFSLVDSYTFMTLDKCLYLQALIGATISITPSKRYIFPLSMAQFLSAVIVTVVIRWQHFHHSSLGSTYIYIYI